MRLLLAIMLMSSSALAQPPGETPGVETKRKSLLNAYLVTWAATVAPAAAAALANMDDDNGPRGTATGIVATAALVLGPSAGHWYVGGGLTTGLALRVGALGGFAALVIADPRDDGALIVGAFGAIAVFQTGLIWDLATLPRAVRRYNKAHELTFAPMISTQGPVAGLTLGGGF